LLRAEWGEWNVIYAEFISRNRSMPVEIFRHLGNQKSDWAPGSKDRVLLQLGRTMRLGPEPGYLSLWEIPGLDRLDAWEAYFHSEAAQANRRSRAMHHAIQIERAGLYDALHQGSALEASLYVIEFWHALTIGSDEVFQSLTNRASAHPNVTMFLAIRRVGLVGPAPEGLTIWGSPSYAAAESLLRDVSCPPITLTDVGLYRSFGDEVL
jgi:hypothetical protein